MAAIGKPSRRMSGIWRRTPRPMLTDNLALAISIPSASLETIRASQVARLAIRP
jgi:hypothetical protein